MVAYDYPFNVNKDLRIEKVQRTSNTSKLGLIYDYENVIPRCNVFSILVLHLIEMSLTWN